MADAPPLALLVALPAESERCPICHGQKWRSLKPPPLYGQQVCRRCYYRFANRRQLAFIIDWLLVEALKLGMLLGWGIQVEAKWSRSTLAADVLMLTVYALVAVLFVFKDGFAGQSPGKALMGVQAVDRDTMKPIGFARSFHRNLPILAIMLTPLPLLLVLPRVIAFGLVGRFGTKIPLLYMAYQLQRGPRWGDTLAKTKVVLKRHRFRVPFDTRGVCCQQCGYDLTGNVSGVCPECGRAI